MTAGEFREVDLDLLADYLGGALDGTPEEAVVARLVADDPAWADAHAALVPAFAAVRADLADWGTPPPVAPPAVVDRITAALAAQPSAPTVEQHRSDPVVAGARHTPADEPAAAGATTTVPAARPGTRRPAEGPGGQTGPGRRRRRWLRGAGPVAVAAVSLAAVGLGVHQWWPQSQDSQVADTAMTEAAPGAPEAAAPMSALPFVLTAVPGQGSGRDYTPTVLAGEGVVAPKGSAASASTPDDTTTGEPSRALPDALDRLTGRPALERCLAGIVAEHGGAPVTVEVLDYATFEGRPALVVEFVDATGARWAWASGPQCGLDGSDADTRYRTRVG
ncbi:hypothetical protein [Micromonospora fluostatini]|uniref:hypothetical protein n=1 Tax=Micromonospora sp. JCM 30529 TaxID=3421643 RepID=UPI003D16AD4E